MGEAVAGAGIDDVGITTAIEFDELFGVAAGGEGLVFQVDGAGVNVSELIDIADEDAPTFAANGRGAGEHIAAGGDEGAADAVGLENFHGFVDGVAFGNAAEVELHFGCEQGNGAVARVEFYFFKPDAGFHGDEGFGGGEFLLASSGAPEADHGAGGGVFGRGD